VKINLNFTFFDQRTFPCHASIFDLCC